MNSSTIDDAWQWLPLKARIALLHFLTDLPRLAGQYHSPELRAQLSTALARVTQESELTTAERAALRMASELVVCGEEVSTAICCTLSLCANTSQSSVLSKIIIRCVVGL